MMRLWSPAEEWAKCVLALEETYNLSLAPQDKQTWMQRLALYFTDVLVAGWELEDDSKPRGTRVYLNDLLTKPVPHTQTLDEYQKTHPGKVGQTLEVRKDFLRETVLELLMQPSVRYTPPKPQSAGEFQHLWWWTPERQAPFIKGYQYVGSVYVKLLEMWALSNKMVAIEAEERVKASGAEEDDLGDDAPVEEEKDRISNKPKVCAKFYCFCFSKISNDFSFCVVHRRPSSRRIRHSTSTKHWCSSCSTPTTCVGTLCCKT
jgi:hypothetical protein